MMSIRCYQDYDAAGVAEVGNAVAIAGEGSWRQSEGRPSKGLMTADFESLVPLLDAYVPLVDKKA